MFDWVTFDWWDSAWVTADLVLRTLPFASLALVLFGAALIEGLQTRFRDLDMFSLTIIAAGTAGFLYLGVLAIEFAPGPFDVPQHWITALLLTLPGVPIVYRNVGRAWRARRSGVFRRQVVCYYDPETGKVYCVPRSHRNGGAERTINHEHSRQGQG